MILHNSALGKKGQLKAPETDLTIYEHNKTKRILVFEVVAKNYLLLITAK
jgi:hypothetical protein